MTLTSARPAAAQSPVEVTLAHDRPSYSPGDLVRLTYTLRNPGSNTGTALIGFMQNFALNAPGASIFDTPNPGTCGPAPPGNTSGFSTFTTSGAVLTGRNLRLAAGESCSFEVQYFLSASQPLGQITQTVNVTQLPASAPVAVSSTVLIVAITPPEVIVNVTPQQPGAGQPFNVSVVAFNNNRAATYDSVTYQFDPAAFFPGAAVSAGSFSNTCQSPSVTSLSATLRSVSMRLGSLEGCSVTFLVTPPPGIAAGDYVIRTGVPIGRLSDGRTFGGIAAETSVTIPSAPGGVATLSMQLAPASAPEGDARSIRYTINLPAGAAPSDRIEFEHDVAFFSPGVTVGTAPGNPCGADSSFVSLGTAPLFGLRGGQVAPGDSCTFDVPILTAGVTPGTFEQRTGPLRTVIGANTFTSPAASAMMEVTQVVAPVPLQFSMSHSNASVAVGNTATVTYTITNPNGNAIQEATNGRFDHDFGAFAPSVTISTLPAGGFCGAGSSVTRSGTYLAFRDISLAANDSCSFTVTYAVPSLFQNGAINQSTGVLLADLQNATLQSPAASSSINVTGIVPLQPASLTIEMNPPNAPAGVARTIRYTLSLPANAVPLGGGEVEFNHDVAAFAAGVTIDAANLPATPCGMRPSGPSFVRSRNSNPATFLELRDANLNPGESCTFEVPILTAGVQPGTYEQRTGEVLTSVITELSTVGPVFNRTTVLTSSAASVMMGVGPAGGLVPLEMATRVDGGPLRDGSPVDYVVTVTNPNGVDVTNADLAIGLGTPSTPLITPTGMSVSFSNFNGGCTGNPTAAPGGALGFTASGATVPANSSCTVTGRVQVDSTVPASSYPVTGFTDFTDAVQGDFPKVFSNLAPVVVTDGSDTTPPVIMVPADIAVSTDAGQPTAVVSFTVTASDDVDGDISGNVTLSQASGTAFPIGVTTVTADVSDAAGNATTQASFTVTVTDDEAPVISVTAPPPVTAAAGATEARVIFTASATDNSGDPVTLVFELADGTVITSPRDFPVGTTVVTVRATDSVGNEVTEDFNVVVNPALQPPVAIDNTYIVAGATAGGTEVTLAGNVISDQTPDDDPDGSGTTGLSATLVNGPTGGPSGAALTLNPDGSFTYVFANNAPGSPEDSASFTYRVTDPDSLQSNIATVTITVQAVPATPNVPPVAQVDGFTITAGMVLNGNILDDNGAGADSDADAGPDPLAVSLAQDVSNGTLMLGANGGFNYTPDAGFTGSDGFEYTLTDGADIATGVVTITVANAPDTTPPVITVPADITVSTDTGQPTAVVSFNVTASDDVDGDISGNVTLSQASGTTFPIGVTTVTADVSDAAGNAAVQASFTVTVTDNEAPVISVTAPSPVTAAAGATEASVTFTASATDNSGDPVTLVFELADGTVITSPRDFPVGTTPVTVRATDSAGNEATGDFNAVVADGSPPTITLSADRTSLRAGQTAIVAFELSEDATDFEETDVTVTGGTLSDFSGSGQSYSATFTPDANSTTDGTLSVASGSFTDTAGNANADGAEADNTLTITIDTVSPSAVISALSGPSNGAFTAAITLSEASTDFAADDLILVNADAVLTGSGANYIATLTPQTDGVLSVTVATGRFSDNAGNLNDAPSNTESVVFDGTAPTVAITNLPETFTAQTVLTASITFSEVVTGFDVSDLSLGNATTLSLSGSGKNYSVRIRPTGRGDVTLQVPANAAQDAAGNGNMASEAVTARNETVEQTQRQIAEFMVRRANQLVANQPDVTCHLRQSCVGGSAEASVTRGQLSFSLNSRPEWPVWFQLSGTRANDGSANSDYLFGAFGTHRAINDNTLVGLLFELDHVGQSDGASRIEGTGWLVGPYFVTRLPNQPLYFEGRLLAGMSHNRIQPFGTYTDSFDTRRLLTQLKVSGYLEYGETTLIPSLAGSYTTDTQLAYTDSLGNRIPEQGIELGQLELGLNFETPATLFDQNWTLGGGISAIYSTTSGSGAAQSVVTSFDGGRARVELSAATVFDNSASLNFGASYDGIGARGFEAIGLELGFQWDF